LAHHPQKKKQQQTQKQKEFPNFAPFKDTREYDKA
jgi:hypothetical protein